MYSLATLTTEIKRRISALETQNRSSIISKRWLTAAVLAQHEDEMVTPFAAVVRGICWCITMHLANQVLFLD